jgi:hypothetical protein
MTQQGKCKDCKFYNEEERTVFVLGLFGPGQELTLTETKCWRHPKHVKVSEDHWCGDYTPK